VLPVSGQQTGRDAAVVAEPERFTAVRWRCPHCQRSRSSKKAITEHMARCWWNPDAKGCKTCEHYYPGDNGCEGDPYCNCASPESCDVGLLIPASGLMIRCEKWESIDD
jgi:hypothetical protein